ncbi:MAG: hypothetical protein NC393_12095 [Clostridium sp.]|nr:hypothetical protein [Clostridium sp.]MCM1172849.1 hypothetical protein [Clostridium sp.]MCM1208418.1 hypothetical protein [Ruminococcus sp.]
MKKFKLITISVAMVLMLTACGNTDKGNSSDAEPTEEAVLSEETEATTEAMTTEATTEEPKPMPYSEEMNLTFGEINSVEAPVSYTYVYPNENEKQPTEIDGVEVIQQKAKYSLGDVTINGEDEEGNVNLTVQFISDAPICFNWDGINSFSWYTTVRGIRFFDYYTGNVMEIGKEEEENETYKEYEIEWEDETYKVLIKKVKDAGVSEWSELEYEDNGDGTKTYSSTLHLETVYDITMSKGYDGLCMAISKKEMTSDEALDEDMSIADKLLDDSLVSDVLCERLSKYISNQIQ